MSTHTQRSMTAWALVCALLVACESEHMIGDDNDAEVADSTLDAGSEDTGAPDTGLDAGLTDLGFEDAGLADLGLEDAGLEDAGLVDSGPADSGVDCVADVKRTFVTSAVYSGNLAEHAGIEDGLLAGDALCQLHADAEGIGGTWKAWLSSTSTDAVDRIDDVGPWYLVDRCTRVANNLASLVVNGPLVGIERTEAGARPAPRNAWTGTEPDGRADLFTCNDWTNDQAINGYEGTIGLPGSTGSFWTQGASNPCRLEARLYCFEL